MAKTKKSKAKNKEKNQIVIAENVEEAFEEPEFITTKYILKFDRKIEPNKLGQYMIGFSIHDMENTECLLCDVKHLIYDHNYNDKINFGLLKEYGYREVSDTLINIHKIEYSCGSINIEEKMRDKLERAYPNIDVDAYISQIECLFLTNPDYLKTIENIPSFVNNYLRKANSQHESEGF